ncbi:MAG TPA: hypothetical protein VGW12_09220 [Pyrinomonadaceae bacterium]|nr:hypothetical protein [Pyrinomonadaceae bacterium]
MMLLTESKSLNYAVGGTARTALLESLQEQGFVPLIRSSRLYSYETALGDAEGARSLEHALAARAEAEAEAPYVRGDLFCVDDYALFLLFGEETDEGVRAGIVYETSTTTDALEKLDAFCRSIRAVLHASRGAGANIAVNDSDAANILEINDETVNDGGTGSAGDAASPVAPRSNEWKPREPRTAASFQRFASDVSATPSPARGEMVEGWLRTSGMLEDVQARAFLRRLSEAHREGRAAALFAGDESVSDALLARLAEVGLLKREILVSCRKDGHALFRLPSPDALSMLSSSNAVCNECGAAIADERAEEVSVPTSLTATLLQDGAWLATHLRTIIINLGVPEHQIIVRPTASDGEVRLMANVCGEAFLFLLHEGDWTTAQARRALDEHARIESAHLVLVATGKIQDDARARLREHARRRTQGGRELELILLEGMDAVASELRPVFERISAEALAEELWELDASLGFCAGRLLATRFRLMREKVSSPKSQVPGQINVSSSQSQVSGQEQHSDLGLET